MSKGNRRRRHLTPLGCVQHMQRFVLPGFECGFRALFVLDARQQLQRVIHDQKVPRCSDASLVILAEEGSFTLYNSILGTVRTKQGGAGSPDCWVPSHRV